MSQRERMQGQPLLIMGDEAGRIQDRDAQEYNISAARAIAEAVRSTLGPKGMDKLLVDANGDTTVTNDGTIILRDMGIDNPTGELIQEVAETQRKEIGDGTTTAVAVAGELLKNSQELLEQGVHPTSIIGGYRQALERAQDIVDDVAEEIDADDEEILHEVAATAMTGKEAEVNKDLLASLVVEAVQQVTVEADDGTTIADISFIGIEKQAGRPSSESELLYGAVFENDPLVTGMPVDIEDADILLLRDPIEVTETETDTTVSIDDANDLQRFLDHEESALREQVQKIVDIGADAVFFQKSVDDPVPVMLAEQGILGVEYTQYSDDVDFLKNVTGATVISDLDSATEDDLGHASIERDEAAGMFYVRGDEDNHGVTVLSRGPTKQVVDEIDRSVRDAIDVVGSAAGEGRVVAGGGAIEVEVAARLRDYADGVEGREQLAVEAFADAIELVPRTLAENAGLDPIDILVNMRAAHDDGEVRAGLDATTGEVVDTFEQGVIEPAHTKRQVFDSAVEVATLVLRVDDILEAGELDPSEADMDGLAPAAGGAPGSLGGGPEDVGGGPGGAM